jgi:threonine/homoserine/homoserine lactone efflux protein
MLPLPEFDSLLLFVLAGLVLNLTPGPDVLYIVARSTTEGRKAGIVSALGVGAGTLFHIAAVALGLSQLLVKMPIAYDVIRWAGALYLVYLGVRAILDPGLQRTEVTIPKAALWRVFLQGMLTNILNPKVAMFFLAFLPQFVDTTLGNAALQIVLLGIIFDINGTIVNVGFAMGAGWIGSLLKDGKAGHARLLRRLSGALFIGLGARLALSTR